MALALVMFGAGGEAFAKDDKYVKVGGTGSGSSWDNALSSIQDAINSAGPLDDIYVSSGTFYETITLDSQTKIYGGYLAGKDLTEFPGQRSVSTFVSTIDGSTSGEGGAPADHVVLMDNISAAVLDGFTITGGFANDAPTGYGGGVFCRELDATNILASCTIQGNFADYGGGIYLVGASPSIVSCQILLNSVNKGGGGVYVKNGSDAAFVGCTITTNAAIDDGGGVRIRDSKPKFTQCQITENTSENIGGGVVCYLSEPLFINGKIKDNTANLDGGGLYFQESDAVISSCNISNNEALGKGGGAYAKDSKPEIKNCTFTGNQAGEGGGLYCEEDSDALVTDGAFTNNSATDGGGAFLSDGSNATFETCTFSGQAATRGGGVFCWLSNPTFHDCTINGNIAYSQGGGAFCNTGSNPIFLGSSFDNNTALSEGGGIFCYESQPAFTSCTIKSNFATSRGGGVFCALNTTALFNQCPIIANEAGVDGGGAYCTSSRPQFRNCNISINLGQGVFCSAASPFLINCTISGNTMQGVYCLDGSTARVLSCTISSNLASRGGGVYCWDSDPIITNTIFDNNSGYAIYERTAETHPLVTNCLFNNNPDGDYFDEGSLIYYGADEINSAVTDASNNVDDDPMFAMSGNAATSGTWTAEPSYDAATSRTTLVDSNASFTTGGLLVGRLINCDVLQQRQVMIVANTTQTLTVLGDVTGYANAVDEYGLVDYRLSDGSGAIDRGTSAYASNFDFDSNWRPVDIPGVGDDRTFKEYDIGAFELQFFTPFNSVRRAWQLYK